jgi:hypothetical protein
MSSLRISRPRRRGWGGLMTPDAWPDDPWPGPPHSIQLNIGLSDSRVTADLEPAIASANALPRLLVAHHPHFRASGFDRRLCPSNVEDAGESQPAAADLSVVVRDVPSGGYGSPPAALGRHAAG